MPKGRRSPGTLRRGGAEVLILMSQYMVNDADFAARFQTARVPSHRRVKVG
jgi:hypothetical protein